MSVLKVIEKKIPILESGFCCCSLYYGTTAVLCLDAFFTGGIFWSACIRVSTYTPSNEDFKTALELLAPDRKAFVEGSLVADLAISVTLIIVFLGMILCCDLALYGWYTRKPRLLVPWLIGTVGRIFIILILAMTLLATARDTADAVKEIQESVRAHRDINRHQTSAVTSTISRTTNTNAMTYTSNNETAVVDPHADQPGYSKRALMNGTNKLLEVHAQTEHVSDEDNLLFRQAVKREKALISKEKREEDKNIDKVLRYKPEAIYKAIVVIAVFLVLFIIMDLYFILVVHSFYVELQNTSEPMTVGA